MRWYVGLFLFALLLVIGWYYNWFGLLKTDLDKANDKFKEFHDFIGEFIPILDKMSMEEQNEYEKKVLIKYDEYYYSVKKLNKPDIIQHAKYMTYFIIETVKKMTNNRLYSNRIESLYGTYTQTIVQIIRDNPDLEKDLLGIAKPIDELSESTMKAFS